MATTEKKSPKQFPLPMKRVLISVAIGLVLALLSAFVAALMMNAERLPPSAFLYVAIVAGFIGFFAASFSAGAFAPKRKLLYGLFSSFVLLLLLVFIGAALSKTTLSLKLCFMMSADALLASVLGSFLSTFVPSK